MRIDPLNAGEINESWTPGRLPVVTYAVYIDEMDTFEPDEEHNGQEVPHLKVVASPHIGVVSIIEFHLPGGCTTGQIPDLIAALELIRDTDWGAQIAADSAHE